MRAMMMITLIASTALAGPIMGRSCWFKTESNWAAAAAGSEVWHGQHYTSPTGKICLCSDGTFTDCTAPAYSNPCQGTYSPQTCDECISAHPSCTWSTHKGGFCNHQLDLPFHGRGAVQYCHVAPPPPPPPPLRCDIFSYCTSCMDQQGCLWDDNWGKCRHEEACDFTPVEYAPVPVAAYAISIDEHPNTNTVCFRTKNQCFTGGGPIITPNPIADRCSKAQSCSTCLPFDGCVYDNYNVKCVTYENYMAPQCESWRFGSGLSASRYVCYSDQACIGNL